MTFIFETLCEVGEAFVWLALLLVMYITTKVREIRTRKQRSKRMERVLWNR